MTPIRAYIGLGSNLDQPIEQVRHALAELAEIAQSHVVTHSRLYLSKPLGPSDQPDYVNAVAALDTMLPPLALLDALFAIEQTHHRIRTRHWGPRTLDLDLLLYGDQIIQNERLTVPHPGLKERNFVLIPLAEIAPDLHLPDGESLQSLVQRTSLEGLAPLQGSARLP